MNNSTQSNVLYSNTLFKQYLMQISTGIIWKDTSRANENESPDLTDLYQAELFIMANRGLLNFDIVKAFPRSVLLNAISNISATNLEVYAADKRKIPVDLRSKVVNEYSRALSSVNPVSGRPAYYNSYTQKYEVIYNESNNYYRMLMGLPDKEDTDYIYNTDLRWSTTTPIHEMSKVDRIEMERVGILDELLKKNPSKKYIEFLGKKYIDPFIARIANRFEILYSDKSASDSINKDFIDSYNSARQMILSVYYNNSFRKTNAVYDNFLAMCILFSSIQSMQHKYLKVDITRDFYDTESLKLVYDSYGVPFYNDIPLEYHQKIVKNINKLISYKGSSKVFLDLFDIFDASTMDIYSYFLTKTHLVDENGIPLFNIKHDDDGNPLYDNEGNPILDESNYKIDFSRVKIYDDPALAISDENNNVEYEAVVLTDPYWIEDAALIEKLTNENFNYLESKYIGIQTVYDLMKITYENAYIFRLIMDNRDLTDTFEIRWTDIGISCSIFEIFVYLSAIYCRFYGYEGLISDKIPAIMDTLGYNFEESVKLLKNISNADPIIQNNSELINMLMDLDMSNPNNIDTTYNYIKDIRELIINGYTNAKTIEEYNIYRELYDSLLISKEITSTYINNATGQLYETFSDMLSDISPTLMQRYLLLEDTELRSEMVTITDKIEDTIESVSHLLMSSGIANSNMIEQLFKILKFFKSAKAELVDYNIVYTISMRGINFFKIMDLMTKITNKSYIDDYVYFIDIMNVINDTIKHKYDMIKMIEEVSDFRAKSYIEDYINKLTDDIIFYINIVETLFSDKVWYIDFIQNVYTKTRIMSYLGLGDSNLELTMLDIVEIKHRGMVKDSINRLTDRLREIDKETALNYVEDVLTLSSLLNSIDAIIQLKYNEIEKLIQKDDIYNVLNYSAKDINKLNDLIHKIINNLEVIDDIDNVIKLIKIIETLNANDNNISNIIIISKLHYLISIGTFISNKFAQSDNLDSRMNNYEVNDNSTIKSEILKYLMKEKSNDGQTLLDITNIDSTSYDNLEILKHSDYFYEFDDSGKMHPVV